MDGRPSLRQRNRDRTALEIATAAFALFRERGYEATTIEQIAAAAGLSPRTFFRYFPTKEDVVFGDHAETVDRLRAALAAADPGQPPLRRVRAAVLAVQQPGRYPEREVARARLVAEVPALRARYSRLVEDFEEVVAEALVADLGPGAEATALARIVAATVFGALRGARSAAAKLTGADPSRLVETAFDLVEGGAARLFVPAEPEAPTSGTAPAAATPSAPGADRAWSG